MSNYIVVIIFVLLLHYIYVQRLTVIYDKLQHTQYPSTKIVAPWTQPEYTAETCRSFV
jgi:hypothetical protein